MVRGSKLEAFTPGFAGASFALALIVSGPSLFAQERIPIDLGPAEEQGAPDTIDILVEPTVPGSPTASHNLECENAADAGEISGEIVVCRKIVSNADRLSGSHSQWLKDYAERTKYQDAPPTPNVDGSGLPFGLAPLVEIKGCFIPPCPKDPALLIDVEALPPPPVGSDAYWQALGITPRGEDGELTPEAKRILEGELGLPPKPDFSKEAEK